MKCRLVQIKWVDSNHTNGAWKWLSQFEKRNPILCVSVGWLIQDDDDVKVIVQTFGDVDEADDMQYAGDKIIPTSAVRSIETLVEADEEECEAA